ncbi:Zinc transporter ZIP9 OS=Gallus gallus GN=SLC39A9 PE=2 SV=1 [Rhizoctonia solani AG-1 IB]|uniref:Zinc transporter ZIP9 n=2 Tax=Thanatephorus cucumeris (strain AG1-IB / isolate 7/3/14) TaxID=1108050 RepID=A0A0B7FLE7_THACB|nr:Zinc transporter ZIP9 OS=Gallus gallus GN=SLC39A9 PE=2 SV=1 [Rhizoctonia solani AG-1 IB]
MGLIQLIVMCTLLGGASFGLGLLPLIVTFSKTRISQISTIGTGLLLGAAMGVVIPEGIEVLHHASESPKSSSEKGEDEVPTRTIALCLLSGFTLMLAIEQLIAPSGHQHQPAPAPSITVFDEDDIEQLELGPAPGDQYPDPLADTTGRRRSIDSISINSRTNADGSKRNRNGLNGDTFGTSKDGNPNAITLGLVIHSIADGLALGASARSGQNALEAIVFLAIIVHKAPTALALSTALMPHLPRQSVKRHITAFALTSPLAALMTYFLIEFLGEHDSLAKWTGIALLFSGGTFLYVATVLQPVSGHRNQEGELKSGMRVLLTVLGMFFPFIAGGILGHGHEH